jgi:hypothetical protein
MSQGRMRAHGKSTPDSRNFIAGRSRARRMSYKRLMSPSSALIWCAAHSPLISIRRNPLSGGNSRRIRPRVATASRVYEKGPVASASGTLAMRSGMALRDGALVLHRQVLDLSRSCSNS